MSSYGFLQYAPQIWDSSEKREKFEYVVAICFSFAMEERTCGWFGM